MIHWQLKRRLESVELRRDGGELYDSVGRTDRHVKDGVEEGKVQLETFVASSF